MTSKIMKVIAVLIFILGLILGIILGACFQVDVSIGWSTRYAFNIDLALKIWLCSVGCGIFSLWLSAVLEKLENIEKNMSKKTTRSPENKINNPTVSPVDYTVKADEWVCSNCGKVNQNYVGTCGCGERKS